jgi:hypothetical protein
MSDRVESMLEAIKSGDAVAMYGLLDWLEETGDDRLVQVKKTWEVKLRELAAEIGLLWTEFAPQSLYPKWRDALVPVMGVLPYLGRYQRSPRCPAAHAQEIGSLVNGFAEVLYRLGCCRGVAQFRENLTFWFAFREHGWWCSIPRHEATWKYRRTGWPLSPPYALAVDRPIRISARRFAQSKSLVRYVLSAAESYLDKRTARRKTNRAA